MIFDQFVIVAASMIELLLQLRDFCLKLCNSAFKQFLFRLSKLGLFFLGEDNLLHFLIESPLDVLEPLLMLDLILIQHLLIHENLCGERLFDAVAFHLDLAESVLEEAVKGLGFTYFAGLLFDLLEGSHFLVEHIISQLAWSVSETGIGAFAKLFRREIVQFRRRLVSGETTVE